jgi:hypothetical protein
MSWLASPAASPLLTAAAVVMAVGWSAAATVLGATVATGHPEAAAVGAIGASTFLLPILDLVTGMISLCWRGRARRARQDAARDFRKAARARRAAGARPRVMRAARGSARRPRRQARFPFLPRPARWGLAAMLWLSVLATVWVLARGLPSWDPATTSGQQAIAWTWMMHLVVWCRIACRWLNRSRSAASMLTSAHAATST